MSFPRKAEDITADWLTQALGLVTGDIQSVSVDFVGDAIGNTSEVFFVRLQLRDGVDCANSFVAKVMPQFEGAIEVDKTLRLFQREIDNYRQVVSKTPIRAPDLVWSDYDPETSLGFMLMEDCSACDSFDQIVPVPTSLEDLEQIFIMAAKLHARWWDSDELPALDGVVQEGHPVFPVFTQLVMSQLKAIIAGGDGFENIPEEGLDVTRRFAENYHELMTSKWPKSNVTVMHVDFRVDNIFFDRTTNEPILFDWQACIVGPGVYDLAYLMATGYKVEFRREHEMTLLALYHTTLIEEGVSGYSLEQAIADYKFGMVNNLWVVTFTAILDLSSDRGQALVDTIVGGIFTGIFDHGADSLLKVKFPD